MLLCLCVFSLFFNGLRAPVLKSLVQHFILFPVALTCVIKCICAPMMLLYLFRTSFLLSVFFFSSLCLSHSLTLSPSLLYSLSSSLPDSLSLSHSLSFSSFSISVSLTHSISLSHYIPLSHSFSLSPILFLLLRFILSISLQHSLGGTQSLHTNSFDEAMGLPTEFSARIAR